MLAKLEKLTCNKQMNYKKRDRIYYFGELRKMREREKVAQDVNNSLCKIGSQPDYYEYFFYNHCFYPGSKKTRYFTKCITGSPVSEGGT